jgi:Zn2+/Cd2+-exporting ATPase
VHEVTILPGEKDASARLAISYDADRLTVARIKELAHVAGAEISERYGHVVWQADGINSTRRAQTVADLLASKPGILEANADASGRFIAEYDRQLTDEPRIAGELKNLGVSVLAGDVARNAEHSSKDHDHDDEDRAGHSHGGIFGANTELYFSLASGVFLATGFGIEKLWSGHPGWLPFACYLAAYFFGGFFTVREAWDNLRLRRFEIDSLMLVAAAGAAFLGEWAEGALLLFLFSFGHALEHYAMGRAKRAIEALAELAPETARVKRGDDVVEVPVEELALGDVVIVRPNERLPADGFILDGVSAINQAPVTGESVPVDKSAVSNIASARANPDNLADDNRVFAGTINGSGALEVEVTRRSSDTTLAKVVQMVSEAEAQQSPTQRFTQRFERIFVPAVLALAGLLLFAWVVIDEPFRDSFYRAMAVLVAASPCALAIATPSAVLSGVARAARSGILVKGGAPLEDLGALKAIAFDKTGTLTEGEPRMTDVQPAQGVSENELLAIASAAENLSDHPLAQAIVRDGKQRLGDEALPEATSLESFTGKGITALVGGERVWIGKLEMFGQDGVPQLGAELSDAIESMRERGRTTMGVRSETRDLGAIGLLDTPRAAAKATLEALRGLGITRMIMISGDDQRVADAVGKEVGLDEAWGNLMPDDKVKAIRKLAGQDKVAMVGDGVNDAPAMANATVGIAMGAAGSDVALETADVALMADDLARLPFAVDLSRQTRSIIRQNMIVSLGIVVVLIPATIFGLGIGPAVAVHEGSTLIVVANALRLLAYKEKGSTKDIAEKPV